AGLALMLPGAAPAGIRLGVAGGLMAWAAFELRRRARARAERRRSPGGTFVVSPAGIEREGGALARERLRHLVVTNSLPGTAPPPRVATGAVYRAASALGTANATAGGAVVSYMLCADDGDRLTPLAGGMTAVTAHGLLTDVSRILSVR